jgi:hypothetical protein
MRSAFDSAAVELRRTTACPEKRASDFRFRPVQFLRVTRSASHVFLAA